MCSGKMRTGVKSRYCQQHYFFSFHFDKSNHRIDKLYTLTMYGCLTSIGTMLHFYGVIFNSFNSNAQFQCVFVRTVYRIIVSTNCHAVRILMTLVDYVCNEQLNRIMCKYCICVALHDISHMFI